MTRSIGRPIPHESATAHVTGGARYVDDLWPHTARVAHAFPVCAPHAHARMLSIDAHPALAQAGVLCVLTERDVPGENDTSPMARDEPLFPREVSFHCQAVAWVIAESEDAARCAAALVEVRYEPLPAILSIADAIAQSSFLTEPEIMRRGDPEAALTSAPHVLEGEVTCGAQEHFYLETQAALSWWDESGGVFVQSSTQHPSQTQEVVARVLGVPRHQVVIQCLRMGGAFGGKEVQANAWAALAALASRKVGRPVRVRLTRAQDVRMTGKRHPFSARYRVGFDAEGRLLGLKLTLFSDGGCSLDLSGPVMSRAMFHADNAYKLPHVEIVGRVCRTHLVSNTAFRGFGGPQGMLAIEEILDRIARALGLSPHAVREANFYRSHDTTHYGQAVRDAERIEQIWHTLKQTSAFDARLEEIAGFNRLHTQRKRGLAITPVKFGISFTATFYNQAGALVLLYKDGSAQVNHGGTEMGQGLHTKIQQVAADALGISRDAVRVMPTRTDKVPNTSPTAASSGADLNGAAVKDACDTLRQRLSEVAATHLAVPAAELCFADGKVYVRGDPRRCLDFVEVLNRAYLARVPLFSAGYYRTPDIHYDPSTGRGKPFHYFAYGAAVSEVEIDGFTGQYTLRRVDILHDVGESLSPLVDRGQIEGGFIQGVGWLTREEVCFREGGALATWGASTYKLPSVGDCPEVFRVALLPRAGEPGVVYGSKAVGEPPFMLALSVREALRAAVAAFGEGSARVDLACPATPEAVFWAIQNLRRP